MKLIYNFFFTLVFFLLKVTNVAAQRFPKPEFKSGHIPPNTTTPLPRALLFEYLDVIVLIVLLLVISYFIFKSRSRKGIFWTSIFSIFYFGFWKEGCICPVGSIQNITLALFDSTYIIPITAILFFALPLLFTLFFGRSFCAGVCFMGAVQDLVILRPLRIPSWVQKTLGIIPYIYLGLAILFAATASDFIICRYDPFIGFFRLHSTFNMYIFGALILLTGVFVARPYCRFICPYGVLLNWMSRISKWQVTITPSECIQCKLCENSCPVDAIEIPCAPVKSEQNNKGTRRLLWLILLVPVLMLVGGLITSFFYKPLSLVNSDVRLAEEIAKDVVNNTKSTSIEANAFYSAGTSTSELFSNATVKQNEFYVGTWILGAFLGLILGLALIRNSIINTKPDFVPNKGNCISCGRCYKYCPVGKQITIQS